MCNNLVVVLLTSYKHYYSTVKMQLVFFRLAEQMRLELIALQVNQFEFNLERVLLILDIFVEVIRDLVSPEQVNCKHAFGSSKICLPTRG